MQNLFKQLQLNNNKFLGLICLLAIGSFLLTLNLPLVGEEGVYTNAALEMMFTKKYNFATLYGNFYPRPPLYNWLIILFGKLFGAKNIVLGARLVTMTATSITAVLLFFITKKAIQFNQTITFKSKFALFTVAVFLSGDLLFKRGWLAYSDPLFAMFVFASMALLIVGSLKNNLFLIFLANCCLFFGFLSKTHTIYVFYAITYLTLLFFGSEKFLLKFKTISLHLLFICLTFAYDFYFNESHFFITTVADIERLLGLRHNPEAALWHNIIVFPIKTWLALLPGSLIILLALLKIKNKLGFFSFNQNIYKHANTNIPSIKIILLITFGNFIPYWFASQSNIRYLLPLYPWFAIIIAYIVWQAELTEKTIILLTIGIIIKYFVAIFWFPYEYTVKYGNTEYIAKNILQTTANYDLYVESYSSAGLRIAGEINKLRWPKQPLQEKPTQNKNYYFVLKELALDQDPKLHLITSYTVKKEQLFLYLVTT